MTVSCRRSALSVRGTDAVFGVVAVATPIDLPQPPQNFAAGSFSKLQARHVRGSGVPHWAQKPLVAALSALQVGQRIQVFPLD
jgi:hypothetical protein